MNCKNISKKILYWYDNNKRFLPWRKKVSNIKREYYTLVSEFMLQQTQVKTVIPYFVNFINKIPNLNFTKGRATIYGVLKKAPRTGILLADNQAEKLNENITRFQKIDTYELTRLIKLNKIKKFANNPFLYPIFPYVIRLSPESEHGYIRNWESRNSGENIHIGYAYQWFAFAATLFVIYLVLNIKRQDHKNE